MGERMGMMLIDSNIIIYYFNGVQKSRDFLNQHAGNMAISTITVSEVLAFPMSEERLNITQQFLEDNFVWLDVTRDVIFKSAEIRRQKKVKTPDALIGATAICHGLTVASRNEKDFSALNIPFINPID